MKAATKVTAITVVSLLILSGCGESVPGQQPAPTPLAGIMMQGGDAAGTGIFNTRPLRKLSEANGGLKWKVKPDPDKGMSIADAQIAANGFVYTVASYSDSKSNNLREILTSLKVHLVALDASTGQPKWSFPEEGLIGQRGQTPVYADGVVYFSTHTFPTGSPTSILYALNAADGKELWRFDRKDGEFGPLVAEGEMLYFLSKEETPNLSLYALDRRTGGEKWKFQANGDSQGAKPTVIDGTVYFSTGLLGLPDNTQIEAAMYAVDANSGQEKWKRLYEEGAAEFQAARVQGGKESFQAYQAYIESISSPQASLREITVANGVAYLLGDEALYAFDTKIGKEKWKLALKYGTPTPPIIAGEVLYFGTVQREGDTPGLGETISVYAVNTSTGQELWKYKVGEYMGNRISNLTIADGVVYFIAGNGSELYALYGE